MNYTVMLNKSGRKRVMFIHKKTYPKQDYRLNCLRRRL